MRKVFTTAIVATLLFPTGSNAQELLAPLVDGRINVVDDSMKAPFIKQQRFYPGERVTLQIDYRIDAMRRMHEDRECWSSWFGGIDCHYVQRSDGSGLQASQVPLTLALALENEGPAPEVEPAMISNDPRDTVSQFPPAAGTFEFTLKITEPQLNTRFTQGYSLIGRVAPRYGTLPAANPIDRRPCSPFRNGQYCSQGEYVLTIKSVDTSVRLNMLETWLSATSRSASEITASVDSWMLFRIKEDGKLETFRENRDRIAMLLFRHAETFYQVAAGKIPHSDRLPILEFARQLNPAEPSIASAIVRTQIASGDILGAQTANKQNIADYSSQYERNNRTEPVLRGYAEALANAANILRARSFDLNPGDVRQATDYFAQSAQIWSEHASAANADLAYSTQQYISARLEQAKTGARISDLVPLDKGIAALIDARSRLPLERPGIATAVSGKGSVLIVDDHFNSAGKDKDGTVAIAFLPPSRHDVIDLDSEDGRLLAREKVGAPIKLVDLRMRTIVALPTDISSGVISNKGVVAVRKDKLIRIQDGAETEMTTFRDKAAWAVARDSGTIAVVDRDGSNLTIVNPDKTAKLPDLSLSEISSVALSRDGKKFAVEGKSNGKRTLLIVDTLGGAISPKPELETEEFGNTLFFSSDGTRAVMSHDGGTLEVIDIANGNVLKPEIGSLGSRPEPLPGNKIAIALGDPGEPIQNVAILLLDKITDGPREGQPADAVRELKLDLELPADTFLPLSPGWASASLVFATDTIGTKKSPVVARVAEASGRMSGDLAITDWHPLQSFPVGPNVGVNPVREPWARLLSNDGAPARIFAADTGERTSLIPVGDAGAFVIVTTASTGGVRRLQLYSSATAGPKTHELDQVSGRRWEILTMLGGTLSQEQQYVALIRRDVPSDPSKPVEVATFDSDGEFWSETITIADSDQIVGITPRGMSLLRRTSKSYVLQTADGASSVTIADCEGKFSCKIGIFQPSRDRYTVTLESDRSLEISDWTASDFKSTNCGACAQYDIDSATAALSRLPFGFGNYPFSVGREGDSVQVAFPAAKMLLTGKLDKVDLASKPGTDIPLFGGIAALTVQAGSVVRRWQNVGQ